GQRRGRHLAFSLLLLGWAMPAVVTAKLFEWLYHPAAGLLNFLLGARLNWLGDPGLALPAVVLADVWRTLPFVAVLAYARLLAIPAELVEAAQVDGAGRAATFRHVTLPLLRRILAIAALFRTLDAYRVVRERGLRPRALGNSLGVAAATTLLALGAGLPAAYAIARLPVPGRRALLLALVASTAFPQIATVSPLYLLLRALRL